ncbi:hypothetical protein BC835DRAFT_1412222 [Cytidiella melzeri]|nr:hypothetical protein BC835DRAFT_1412222 [Cytidiella melzeri]
MLAVQRRITVVAVADSDGDHDIGRTRSERLVAYAVCPPPPCTANGQPHDAQGMGNQALERFGVDYGESADRVLEEVFSARGSKKTPQSVWHFAMVGIDPSEQGKGHLSRLIREAYVHSPGASFALKVNGRHSGDCYEQLGFKGKVRQTHLATVR